MNGVAPSSDRERGLGETAIGDLTCRWGERTYVMGVLNVTPDSFSGDGLLSRGEGSGREDELAARAAAMVAQGADLLDVGGESTRPGHAPVPAEEELARVLPAIARLRAAVAVPLSIDTSKARVAEAALAAGAALVNDVWGTEADPEIADVAAAAGAPLVLVHNQRGHEYRDLVGDVVRGLARRLDRCLARGVAWERLIVDPGIGFGKTWRQNLLLLRRLRELTALGRPILLGASRKGTIARVLGDLAPDDRVEGTAAMVALGIGAGVEMVRVHDVGPLVRVCRMCDAIVRG
jgi:dihydropteroate synthase